MFNEQKLFSLGQIVVTPNAFTAFEKTNSSFAHYLKRHLSGDWGDLCDEDKKENEESLKTGARIFSSYFLPDETKIWIITDAEYENRREVTTILLPEDY